MKVNVTLEFPDGLRHYIGRNSPPEHCISDGRATREACIAWLCKRLQEATGLAESWVPPDIPSEVDLHEASDALRYLRAAGSTEEKIVAWVLSQRALLAKLRESRRV